MSVSGLLVGEQKNNPCFGGNLQESYIPRKRHKQILFLYAIMYYLLYYIFIIYIYIY